MNDFSANPVCIFDKIATLGYANMILTNITMLVATVLFLRNLRLTRLGAMVNSIVACLFLVVHGRSYFYYTLCRSPIQYVFLQQPGQINR